MCTADVLNQAVEGDGIGEIEVACLGVDEGVGEGLICRGVDVWVAPARRVPDTAYWVIPLVESCEGDVGVVRG